MPGGAGAGLGRGFSVAFRRAKVNDDEEDDEYDEYEDEEEDEEYDEQGLDRCVSILPKVVSHTAAGFVEQLSRVTSSSNNRTLLPVHLLQLCLTAVGYYNVRIVFVRVGAPNRKTFLVFELMLFLLARMNRSRDESRCAFQIILVQLTAVLVQRTIAPAVLCLMCQHDDLGSAGQTVH